MNTERLLLRAPEVAELLGMSRAKVYEMMKAQVLPVVTVPGARAIRVPREALLRWVETNTTGAQEE